MDLALAFHLLCLANNFRRIALSTTTHAFTGLVSIPRSALELYLEDIKIEVRIAKTVEDVDMRRDILAENEILDTCSMYFSGWNT